MKFPTIVIKTIPHSSQTYETVGNWRYIETPEMGKHLLIEVSRMKDWRYIFLVAVHELIEVFLCRHKGITQKQVDDFDIAYEKKRKPGDVSEPGDDYRSPYSAQHCISTGVERILAACLGVSWKKYESTLNAL